MMVLRFVRRLVKLPCVVAGFFLLRLPYFRFIRETKDTQVPITLQAWFVQKVIGINRTAYWPVHPTSEVKFVRNIYCGIETSPGFMPNCYIIAMSKIYIGDYTQIGPNVGLVTAGHALHDNRQPVTAEIRIGRYCWIGMGAIILPGVVLGDYTIVGAGSVVTKSFEDGYCVLVGSPAKAIRKLNPDECVFHKSQFEYNGYIPANEFEEYRKKNLYVDRINEE